ncbi:hypothetical protein RF11_15973 [Thelohanellus kitauei]|uniref:Uncharacterized protein n=1 Tax=Thelohanellus kitauei TaxID=669202 RepID=A0A0C2MFB8_THEKT|nr:hypothetical protein RF11_04119 [Thelohanellus kitauei]KII66514.1 hypothetical protein RF11_15973 [Thelohanellus kitauei]
MREHPHPSFDIETCSLLLCLEVWLPILCTIARVSHNICWIRPLSRFSPLGSSKSLRTNTCFRKKGVFYQGVGTSRSQLKKGALHFCQMNRRLCAISTDDFRNVLSRRRMRELMNIVSPSDQSCTKLRISVVFATG